MEGVDWYLILNEEKIIWLFYFQLIKYLNLNLKEFWIQIKSNKLINIFKRYSISKKILLISLSLKYICIWYMILKVRMICIVWDTITQQHTQMRKETKGCSGQEKKIGRKVTIIIFEAGCTSPLNRTSVVH